MVKKVFIKSREVSGLLGSKHSSVDFIEKTVTLKESIHDIMNNVERIVQSMEFKYHIGRKDISIYIPWGVNFIMYDSSQLNNMVPKGQLSVKELCGVKVFPGYETSSIIIALDEGELRDIDPVKMHVELVIEK